MIRLMIQPSRERGTEKDFEAARRGGVQVKKALFDKLVESVHQAGRIHRGEEEPSRKFVFEPEAVRAIRERLKKSQSEFAPRSGPV